MARNGIPVVDGDGHVMEDWDALLQYMPEPYIKSGRFKANKTRPCDWGPLIFWTCQSRCSASSGRLGQSN